MKAARFECGNVDSCTPGTSHLYPDVDEQVTLLFAQELHERGQERDVAFSDNAVFEVVEIDPEGHHVVGIALVNDHIECAICHEKIVLADDQKTWHHKAFADPSCHTGDGATAYPRLYYVPIDDIDWPDRSLIEVDTGTLLESVQEARDAASGDSNDNEIELLTGALDEALGYLGIKMPEPRPRCDDCGEILPDGTDKCANPDCDDEEDSA